MSFERVRLDLRRAFTNITLISLFIQLSGQVNAMHEHSVVVAIFCLLQPMCFFSLLPSSLSLVYTGARSFFRLEIVKLNCSTHSLWEIIRILVLQCHVATTKLINLLHLNYLPIQHWKWRTQYTVYGIYFVRSSFLHSIPMDFGVGRIILIRNQNQNLYIVSYYYSAFFSMPYNCISCGVNKMKC